MKENIFDRQSYEILNNQQPGMIKSIRAGLKLGKSPEEIAGKVKSRSGIIRDLVLSAACYLKSHEGINVEAREIDDLDSDY